MPRLPGSAHVQLHAFPFLGGLTPTVHKEGSVDFERKRSGLAASEKSQAHERLLKLVLQ